MWTDFIYPEPPPPDVHDEVVHHHTFWTIDPNVTYYFTHEHLMDDPGHGHPIQKMMKWARDGEGYLEKQEPVPLTVKKERTKDFTPKLETPDPDEPITPMP